MIDSSEYAIRAVALPYSISGVTVIDENGFYNIYINSRLSENRQREAIDHELKHVRCNDFHAQSEIEYVEPYRVFEMTGVDTSFVEELTLADGRKMNTTADLMRFFVTLTTPVNGQFETARPKRSSLDIFND